LDEEIDAVIAYRTKSDEHREMSYKKLTYMMIDEDIVYLSESSVYRILKKSCLLGPLYKEKGDASFNISNPTKMLTGKFGLPLLRQYNGEKIVSSIPRKTFLKNKPDQCSLSFFCSLSSSSDSTVNNSS